MRYEHCASTARTLTSGTLCMIPNVRKERLEKEPIGLLFWQILSTTTEAKKTRVGGDVRKSSHRWPPQRLLPRQHHNQPGVYQYSRVFFTKVYISWTRKCENFLQEPFEFDGWFCHGRVGRTVRTRSLPRHTGSGTLIYSGLGGMTHLLTKKAKGF